ncbi:mutagen-sensitive 312 [Musca autumnalis]|uniref:mutagen-sensitive 312 n=1 Tax=Musca autumnalis TaxID=221902 RepID=UPI003CE90C59
MDRETRKANLKKLQLPGTVNTRQRKKQQSASAKDTGTASISNYFTTPEKFNKQSPPENKEEKQPPPPYNEDPTRKCKSLEKKEEETLEKPKTIRSKRTKLDEFVFKEPQVLASSEAKTDHHLQDDDFVVPEKKVKKAPQTESSSSKSSTQSKAPKKTSKKKRQTTIKSAFLRNEQMFAEIAAQHCAADNFNAEDIQLALAISRSEAESKGIVVAADDDNVVVGDIVAVAEVSNDGVKNAESIRQKLAKYGFRTAEKEDYNAFAEAFMAKSKTRTKKSKWASKFTTLTLRDEQLQKKKLQQQIDSILNKQFCKVVRNLEEEEANILPYKIQSRILKTCQKTTHTEKIVHYPEEAQDMLLEDFFVTELFSISKINAGHLLRKWEAIQGRDDFTPKKQNRNSEKMAMKMHQIYADLENYYSKIKNASIEEDDNNEDILTKNQDETTEDNKPIDYFKNLRYPDDEKECMPNSGSSITSSIYKQIVNLIPPTKSLDLMQISGGSTDTNAATANTTQAEQDVLMSTQKTKTSISECSSANNDVMESLAIENDNEETKCLNFTKVVENCDIELLSNVKINPESAEKQPLKSSSSSKCLNSAIVRENCDIEYPKSTGNQSMTSVCDNNVSKKYVPINVKETTSSYTPNKPVPNSSINSTQKTRSNSPDLFADSDVEMEDAEEEETNNDLTKGPEYLCSLSTEVTNTNVIEIFSSEDAKDTLSSESQHSKSSRNNDSLGKRKHEEEENVIDLTQDDVEEDNETDDGNFNATINQSKSIAEVDIFADSPLSDELFIGLTDINSNSETSKYVNKDAKDDEFKLSLSLGEKLDAHEDFFKSPEQKKKRTDNNDSELQVSISNGINNIEDNGGNEISLFSTKFHVDICQENSSIDDDAAITDVPNRKTNEKLISNQSIIRFPETSFNISESGEHLSIEQCKDNDTSLKSKEVNKIVLNSPLKNIDIVEIPDDNESDEDMVLREMEINQSQRSFLNFQGCNQLQTSFHRETATVKDYSRKSATFLGNDTTFRELYNKYLGGKANRSEEKKTNESLCQKSFSQMLPKINTPPVINRNNETRFSMDLEMTVEHCITNRKSLSFQATSPEKPAQSTKSQSFSMQNHSIDLTQNEDDTNDATGDDDGGDDGDDECLVLSDDEINYSIWQANKTNRYKDSNENSEDENHKDTSIVLDIINNDCSSPPGPKELTQTSYSDFDEIPNRPTDLEYKLERSRFGIMEEFSEPFSEYPNQMLKEASFLQTPDEVPETMKRYSHSKRISQKFTTLLSSVEKEAATFDDDFDEFDMMVYENQITKASTSSSTVPQGLDQLLTAEISLKESQETLSSSGRSSQNSYLKQLPTITSSTSANKLKKAQTFSTASHHQDITCKTTSATKFHSYKSSSDITKPSTSTKTPNNSYDKQILTINNKTYCIRSMTADEVKPDYSLYTEAELLKELYNYGIKPLKRKQAVKMLEYIYLQTHPVVVDETPADKIIENHSSSTTAGKSSISSISSINNNGRPKKTPLPAQKEPTEISDNFIPDLGNKFRLNDGLGLDMTQYSHDLKSELFDENYILQTNVTKKTPRPLLPFHIAWYNLVCSNRKLHESILMYEPIDLQEIYLFLKGLGYRYDPKDLKQFFDQRCIIFRYDLATAAGGGGSNNNVNKEKAKNRHVRKKNKSSNKQSSNINIS